MVAVIYAYRVQDGRPWLPRRRHTLGTLVVVPKKVRTCNATVSLLQISIQRKNKQQQRSVHIINNIDACMLYYIPLRTCTYPQSCAPSEPQSPQQCSTAGCTGLRAAGESEPSYRSIETAGTSVSADRQALVLLIATGR
jgi:hypothetical protein